MADQADSQTMIATPMNQPEKSHYVSSTDNKAFTEDDANRARAILREKLCPSDSATDTLPSGDATQAQ